MAKSTGKIYSYTTGDAYTDNANIPQSPNAKYPVSYMHYNDRIGFTTVTAVDASLYTDLALDIATQFENTIGYDAFYGKSAIRVGQDKNNRVYVDFVVPSNEVSEAPFLKKQAEAFFYDGLVENERDKFTILGVVMHRMYPDIIKTVSASATFKDAVTHMQQLTRSMENIKPRSWIVKSNRVLLEIDAATQSELGTSSFVLDKDKLINALATVTLTSKVRDVKGTYRLHEFEGDPVFVYKKNTDVTDEDSAFLACDVVVDEFSYTEPTIELLNGAMIFSSYTHVADIVLSSDHSLSLWAKNVSATGKIKSKTSFLFKKADDSLKAEVKFEIPTLELVNRDTRVHVIETNIVEQITFLSTIKKPLA